MDFIRDWFHRQSLAYRNYLSEVVDSNVDPSNSSSCARGALVYAEHMYEMIGQWAKLTSQEKPKDIHQMTYKELQKVVDGLFQVWIPQASRHKLSKSVRVQEWNQTELFKDALCVSAAVEV